MIAQASGHARRDSQRLVDSGEIVVYGMDRNHCRVILKLLAESIRKARESAHSHPHRQVVPFYIGRAYVLGIGITADNLHVSADALGRTITAHLGIGRCAVYLLQLRVVNIRSEGILYRV